MRQLRRISWMSMVVLLVVGLCAFSSARSRSRSACSWRSVAAFFSHAALSSMGKTPLYWPGLRIERVTTVAAEMCTWSAISRWPRMIAPPPTVQWRPMRRCRRCRRSRRWRVCAPMRTLWPIWTRLSSLTPSSITVSSSAPRSMQVLAPISTSSPMRDRAELLDLLPARRRPARSRSRRHRSPRRRGRCRARRCGSRRRRRHAGASRVPRPTRASAPMQHARRSTAPAPTTRAGARRRPAAPIDASASTARARLDDRARVDAGRRRAPRAARPTIASAARNTQVGIGADDAPRRAPRRRRASPARRSRSRLAVTASCAAVARVGEEGDASRRRPHSSGPMRRIASAGVADQLAAEQRGDLGDASGHAGCPCRRRPPRLTCRPARRSAP